MPDSFPVDELTSFLREARRALIPNGVASSAWKELAGASNLIGWRFRASHDALLEFRTSHEKYGDGGNHEELYKREKALFMVFSAGVSSAESTVYALAAAASFPGVIGIPFDAKEQRACNPKNLAQWLSPHPKASDLSSALAALLASPEWALWVDLRNRMTHRSNLPRRLFAYVGSTPPPTKPVNFAATSSSPEVEAEFSDFEALQVWLGKALQSLLSPGVNLLSAA